MDPVVLTNEERTELEQVRRQRWNWLGVLLLGVVLVIAAAASSDAAWLAIVGVALGVLGEVMRGKATKRLQLLDARDKDRSAE